nr:glutamine synthetase family protein [Dehalococcoidales bacterium]
MAASDVPEVETADGVLEYAERNRVRFVNLQFVDILGLVKSVTIPAHQLENCIRNGKWFDGSSIGGFARVAESDMYLKPDLSTFAIIPWQDGGNVVARMICWVHTPNGEPFPGDPRHVLRKALLEVARLGYSYHVGPEFEFFLFKLDESGRPTPALQDQAGYFDLATDVSSSLRQEIVNSIEGLGIPVESSHHETAAGQQEIDLKYDSALKAADSAVSLKYAVKAVAQRHGLHASFMPKPVHGIHGSGMHIHQSFFKLGTETNAFHSPDGPYGLSELAQHFIAGQLYHARGMCAIMSPLVNSYKRLVPGYEAPVYISWARINRSALIRIPKFSPGNPQGMRLELRFPDPSCNPYL